MGYRGYSVLSFALSLCVAPSWAGVILPDENDGWVRVGTRETDFSHENLASLNEQYALLWHWFNIPHSEAFQKKLSQDPRFKDYFYGKGTVTKLKRPIEKGKDLTQKDPDHYINAKLLRDPKLPELFEEAKNLFCKEYSEDEYCKNEDEQEKIWKDRTTEYLVDQAKKVDLTQAKDFSRHVTYAMVMRDHHYNTCNDPNNLLPNEERPIAALEKSLIEMKHNLEPILARVDQKSAERVNEAVALIKPFSPSPLQRVMNNPKGNSPLTLELLQNPIFQPATELRKDGIIFFMSRPFQSDIDTRLSAIMYVQTPDGKIYPRFLYKSNSDGGWRSAPAVGGFPETDVKGDILIDPKTKQPVLNKLYLWKSNLLNQKTGQVDLVDHPKGHYTQETKLDTDLATRLLTIEKRGHVNQISWRDTPEGLFLPERLKSEKAFTYGEEVIYPDSGHSVLSIFQKYSAGSDKRTLTRVEEKNLEKLKAAGKKASPQDVMKTKYHKETDLCELFTKEFQAEITKQKMKGKFIPDFTGAPSRQYKINHTLLSESLESDIQVRVFQGELEGRPVEWHMANDPMGRVWIDRIVYADAKVNSYGTNTEVIDSGALTHKPLEYRKQLKGKNLSYVRDFPQDPTKKPEESNYVDLAPLLRQIPPIREYAEHYGITYQGPKPDPSRGQVDCK